MSTVLSGPTWTVGSLIVGKLLVDDNGCKWGIGKTSGWYDLPSMRLFNSSPPRNSGAYRSTSYKGGRTITIPGWIESPSQVLRETARTALVGLPFLGGQLPLSVVEQSGARTALVELVDCKAAPAGVGTSVDWQLVLFANDPRKYAPSQTVQVLLPSGAGGLDWATGGGLDWTGGGTGGLVWGAPGSNGTGTLVNPGTADTWPVYTISANGGSITNPSITDTITGKVLAFSLALAGSDVLVVTTNPLFRSVLLNGVDRNNTMTSAQWESIPPQSSLTVQFQATGSTGAPSLSASFAPADW